MTTTAPTTAAQPLAARAWLQSVGLVALTWIAILALLHPTLASMISVWDSSETYTHGYVVLPISLWLIWRQRREAMAVPARGDWRALPLVLALSALWLAARIAGVQVIEHYALVALALASVWALLGWRLIWTLFFPLTYLLLMVPNGDSLIPHLINFTADFTVGTLHLLNIPVYREGSFFSLPSGDWSVVEACSGMRYFLSSIVLGWLYAYLSYRTWWKRLAFGVASIVVPILANGFRAVIIVLMGHFSNMTLAVGFDHLIYGWIWFGIVMLGMFWVGNRWREDDTPSPSAGEPVQLPRPAWPVALAAILAVGATALYAQHLAQRPPLPSPLKDLAPPTGWLPSPTPVTDWQPQWRGMDDVRSLHLVREGHSAMLYVGWYGTQRQNAELINSQNVLAKEKDETWRRPSETDYALALPGGATASVRDALLDSRKTGQRLRVWYWNHVDGADVGSPFEAKLLLAWNKLRGLSDAGAIIILAVPYDEVPKEAEPSLRHLAEAVRRELPSVLDARSQ